MNTLQAFAVRDIKSELYSQPHFVQTLAVALRGFQTACEDTSTQLNAHPEDFSLYHIGSFNIENGQLENIIPQQISNASEFQNKTS